MAETSAISTLIRSVEGIQHDLEKIKTRLSSAGTPFVFYDTGVTNPTYWLTTFSTMAKTKLDLSVLYNLPSNISAIFGYVSFRDSDPVNTDCFCVLSPNSTANSGIVFTALPSTTGSRNFRSGFFVQCDSGGDIYLQIKASGTNTAVFGIEIWGYVLKNSTAIQDAQTLQGYAPATSGSNSHIILTDPYGNFPDVDWRYWAPGSYVSSTSVTVSGNVTARCTKGTKIRITQPSGTKYFYAVSATYSSPWTTITLNAGSDYVVANEAITDIAYSHLENPAGFPEWFNYACAWTGSVSNPSLGNGTLVSRFCTKGTLVTVQFRLGIGTTTTFGSGRWNFSLPIPCETDANLWSTFGTLKITDSSTSQVYTLIPQIIAGGTTVYTFYPTNSIATSGDINGTTPIIPANGDFYTMHFQFKF